MKKIAYIIVMLIVIPNTWAKETNDPNQLPKEPDQLVKNRVDLVVSILANKALDKDAKTEKIVKAVSPVTDFKLMSMLALGKTHWNAMTPEQQQRFEDLFINRLKNFYGEKLHLYKDETIEFQKVRKIKSRAYVPTLLKTDNDPIQILFKLHNRDGAWKIYDLEIQDVSIIMSYRSQFSEILRTGTIEDLLKKLESPDPEQDEQ